MLSLGQSGPTTEGWCDMVAQKIGSYPPGPLEAPCKEGSVLPPGGCFKPVATELHSRVWRPRWESKGWWGIKQM